MKLRHSEIKVSGRTNPIHEQSKFVRGIKAIGRELSGFAGVAVLATGISTVLLFSSCGSSSTGNPTPKIEDVSIQDQSKDSDASSYFSYCPDKDKRVYGNGPDPITTLQIGDKINLDGNNYLEFAGVNAEGKAVFNIKSKSTNDLVGLVVLGQGEQKTITSADGITMLILEACTVGIDSVTVGANTKLDPYSPQKPDVSSDESSQDTYEAPDVQVEYTDAQTNYDYEVAVDGTLIESECDYYWPGPFGGIYGVGEPIIVFGCIQFEVEGVYESPNPDKPYAVVNWSDSSGLLDNFKLSKFGQEDVSFVITVDGAPFQMAVRVDSLMLSPSPIQSESWAELIFSRNTNTELCSLNKNGLVAENTALANGQALQFGWETLLIKSFPPINSTAMVIFADRYLPIKLGSSQVSYGNYVPFYQIAVCDYNEATATYWVQAFAVK